MPVTTLNPALAMLSLNEETALSATTEPNNSRYVNKSGNKAAGSRVDHYINETYLTSSSINSPVPDLIIETITWSPENPEVGDEVTFTVIIKNQGSGQAGVSNVKCYIDDARVTSAATNPIAPGASLAMTFFWEAQAGTHTIKAVVDSGHSVIESDETNNALMFAFSVDAPDLIIDKITYSPESPQIGVKATFTVSIKNQGGVEARSSRLYLYIDGVSRGYQEVRKIEAGAAVSHTFTWITRPGSHEIKAIADGFDAIVESDESNNEMTVTYSTLAPDLIIQAITWSPAVPSTGDNVTFTITIKNAGKSKSYSSRVAYYIDGSYLTSDYVGPLGAGATTTTTLNREVQSRSHVFKAIADSEQKIAESDETNNTKTASLSTTTPDLVVQSITWSPSSPLPAHRITFTVTIKNQGNYEANSSRIYLYVDSSFYQLYVEEIGAGATVTKTFPWLAQAGSHTIRAVVDAENSVMESNESNNVKTAAFSSPHPLPGDLVVQNMTWSPENPVAGDKVTFTVTVKNQGSGRAGGSSAVLYIDDAFFTSSSINDLSPGAGATVTFSWEAQAGLHTVEIIADSDNSLAEKDESNNMKVATISVAAPDLFIMDVTCSPASSSPGDTVAFTITIQNRGNYKAGHSNVGYFIDGSPRGYHAIEGLEVGDTVMKTFNWISQPGSHDIRIVADIKNEVLELDEGNNERTITFPIPDLVVESITWSPENPTAGEVVIFSVILKNQSDGKAQPSSIDVYIDSSSQHHLAVEELKAGATVVKTFTWIAEPGSHAIKAVADEANLVIETNNSNNERTATVLVFLPPADTSVSSPISMLGSVSAPDSQWQEAVVRLNSRSNEFLADQDILLDLHVVNPVDNPIMTVELVLEIPAGINVVSPEFNKGDEGHYSASYSVAPGDTQQIEIRLRANREGSYGITGHLVYYFAGDKSTATDQVVSLPVTVGTAEARVEEQPAAGSSENGFWRSSLFISAILVVSGALMLVLITLRFRRKSRRS